MDRYFNGEEFSEAEIRDWRCMRMSATARIVPVTYGFQPQSAGHCRFCWMILSAISRLRSTERCAGVNDPRRTRSLRRIMISQKQSPPLIFKTIVDPFIGKYSHDQDLHPVLSRTMIPFTMSDKDAEEESISKLYVFEGKQADRGYRAACRRYRSDRQA